MADPIIHFEINSKMAPALHEFYSTVFDWSIDANNPMSYGMVDTKAGAGIKGGIGPTDGEPSVTWYVGVPDTDAALKKIEGLGGRTVMPTTTVMEMVTIALFADPDGNVVGLVKSDPDGDPSTFTATDGGGIHGVEHVEVLGTDATRLQSFYRDAFGWEIFDAGNDYGAFMPPDGIGTGGGVSRSLGEPVVLFYINTDDVAGTLKRIEEHGGKTMKEPETMPGVVEFAAFHDPEGNLLGLARSLQ